MIHRMFTLSASALCLALGLTTQAGAAPIAFAAADYDNSASQTSGVFRDISQGVDINRGASLNMSGTQYNALNFTGNTNNAPLNGALTVYDTTPGDAASSSLFTGSMTMYADVLISGSNNARGVGLVTMFNEETGTGLSLYLQSAGNTDGYSIRLIEDSLVPRTTLANVSLTNQVVENRWYQLMLSLIFSGDDLTITGQVFGHTDASNPNSALGLQVGSTLTYSDTKPWTAGLVDPYQIGLAARNNTGGQVRASVTNFGFDAVAVAPAPVNEVPEPASLALMGLALAGLGMVRRRRQPA